ERVGFGELDGIALPSPGLRKEPASPRQNQRDTNRRREPPVLLSRGHLTDSNRSARLFCRPTWSRLLFLGDFGPLLPRFGKADGNRLLLALDLLAGFAAFLRSLFRFVHRLFDFL